LRECNLLKFMNEMAVYPNFHTEPICVSPEFSSYFFLTLSLLTCYHFLKMFLLHFTIVRGTRLVGSVVPSQRRRAGGWRGSSARVLQRLHERVPGWPRGHFCGVDRKGGPLDSKPKKEAFQRHGGSFSSLLAYLFLRKKSLLHITLR